MPFRVRHLWAGESHLRFKHKLPSEFEKKAEASPDRHRFTMPPDIFTEYLLTEEVVKGILKEAENFAPGPQVVTICIGSNDLRDHPNTEMALKLLGLVAERCFGVDFADSGSVGYHGHGWRLPDGQNEGSRSLHPIGKSAVLQLPREAIVG